MNTDAKILTKYWKKTQSSESDVLSASVWGYYARNARLDLYFRIDTLQKIHISMPYQYRYKNPEEDTRKPNQATSKEDYIRRQVRAIPGVHCWLNIQKSIIM